MELAGAPDLPRPSGRERKESQGARARPRGAWPGRGAPGAAQRPLMFANPGLSGGRGPSCWPNNRRLKGECRARGALGPDGRSAHGLPARDRPRTMRGDSARSGAHTRPRDWDWATPPRAALRPGPALAPRGTDGGPSGA